MNTTPLPQLLASKKYYKEHKTEINERRKEYFKEYNKQKAEEIRNNDEKRLARNEYHRLYRQSKKASMINGIYLQKMMTEESLEMGIMKAMVR